MPRLLMTIQLDSALTEDRVCRLIGRWMPSGYVWLPRFTPPLWWENDVVALTKAGRWLEFEVKLTRADFRNDAKKQQVRYTGTWMDRVEHRENKYDLMATTDRGPSRFFYVAPVGVIPRDELPKWAGLLEVQDRPGAGERWRYAMSEVIPAPKRHNRDDSEMFAGIFRSGYYRFIAGQT